MVSCALRRSLSVKASLLTIRMPLGFRSLDVDLQRGWIHGHQDVHGVAWREHVAGGKLDLEAADARDGSRRGANFGGIVRECGQVVSVQGHSIGELASRDLHAVAGIAAKAEHRLSMTSRFVLASGNIRESRHRGA